MKRLAGVLVGSRAMAERLVAFVAQRGLRPLVDRVFAFDDARPPSRTSPRASTSGKVVVRIA